MGSRAMFAVEGLGKQTGRGSLSNTSGAGEEIGMGNPSAFYCIFDG